MRGEFSQLITHLRFVYLVPRVLMPLTIYVQTQLGVGTDINCIGALTRLALLCPDTTDWWVQMVAIPLPAPSRGHMPKAKGPRVFRAAADELKRRLWDDAQVEVPSVA